MSEAEQRWALATTAIHLLKADPSLKGILVGSAHGPVQQAWLKQLGQEFQLTTVPVSVSNERLCGGLDISQTLAAGKPVFQQGLLDTPDGALLVNGAERLDTLTTSTLGAHLERSDAPGTVLVVMDESLPDETGIADSSIADRLAMMIELPSLPFAVLQTLAAEQASTNTRRINADGIRKVRLTNTTLQEITLLAQRLGVDSLRSLLFAVHVARVHAAINGRREVTIDDAAIAVQLVLAPRATTMDGPQEQQEEQEEPSEEAETPDENSPPHQDDTHAEQDQPPDDNQEENLENIGEQLLEAAAATLPQNLIADLVRGQRNRGKAGRDATATGKGRSGRPTGVRRPRGGLRDNRLNIVETLKAAAPKQRIRGNALNSENRLQVRVEDFRITRYKQPTRTTTVFVVDASGSAALHRLAEAKGAVELLLAECYVRRDRVALISFRGTEAHLDLPPTRSLVRAKRELASLPGGGGTPLAAGLGLATQVVQQLKQAGETPVLVVMTDGKANIAIDGEASRPKAMDDAHLAARALANAKVKCLFVDTAPRARPQARELANALAASYLPLPSLDASTLPDLVRG